MKEYFKLFEEVVLVPNTKGNGALYNLLTGNVYELSREQTKGLMLLEDGATVAEATRQLSHSFDLLSYLNLLSEESFGFFSSTSSFVPKMYHTDSLLKQTSIKIPPAISKAFIVLENDCYQKCDYCNAEYVRKNACIGCFRQIACDSDKRTSFNQYITFLNYMKKIKAQSIYFTGGDLIYKWTDNLSIIKEAANLGFQRIFIILGGIHEIPSNIIRQLDVLHVSPIFQVIVDEKGEIENPNLVANANSDSYFCVLFKTNDSALMIESANKIRSTYNLKGIFIDRIVRKQEIQPLDYEFFRPKRATSVEDFSYALEYNQCLNGTITLNTTQEILVCPRMTKIVVGDIDSYDDCLSEEKAQVYWGITKDKVRPCHNCHLKYICGDCRFFEMSLSNELYLTVNCHQ